jgi:hypothetical protein
MRQKSMSYGVWRDSKTWWKLALSRYMAKKHPEKLIFNPRLIEVTEHHVRFGMRKHYGTLRLSKKIIIEVLHPEWN